MTLFSVAIKCWNPFLGKTWICFKCIAYIEVLLICKHNRLFLFGNNSIAFGFLMYAYMSYVNVLWRKITKIQNWKSVNKWKIQNKAQTYHKKGKQLSYSWHCTGIFWWKEHFRIIKYNTLSWTFHTISVYKSY